MALLTKNLVRSLFGSDSHFASCVSPAYIIAVRNWRVRSTKSERKQRIMRHY